MDKPVRIQLSRKKGWRMPENTRSVARPTIYGNPFVSDDPSKAVTAFREHCRPGTVQISMGPGKVQFAEYIHKDSLHWAWSDWLHTEGLAAIRGKNLACWCPLDQPCHADVLLEIANQEQSK